MNVYLSPEAVRNLQEIRDKHLSLGYSNAAKKHLKAFESHKNKLGSFGDNSRNRHFF